MGCFPHARFVQPQPETWPLAGRCHRQGAAVIFAPRHEGVRGGQNSNERRSSLSIAAGLAD